MLHFFVNFNIRFHRSGCQNFITQTPSVYLFIRLSVLLSLCTALQAQPYYFRHYQVENGLSNNTVYCSIQDKSGFVWFGTKDGLNRFDGYRFKVFNTSNGDESGLTKDEISSLALDRAGTLWVGSQKGLHYFDALNERLVPFIDTLHNISDLCIDRSGQLWFLASGDVCRFNFTRHHLTRFPAASYFAATSICQNRDGSMWFSTPDGFLKRMNGSCETFASFDAFTRTAASRWVEKVVPGPNGTLYVGTSSQGIKQFDPATGTFTDLLTYNADKTTIYVRDILQASQTQYWFATESGIFILNLETGRFTNLQKKYQDPYSLSDNAIYALHKDSEGGIWAGTYFGGINYFPRQYASFQKYFPDYTKNSISGSAVREICEDGSGNIWIGTEDAGLNKLNPKTGQFTRYKPTGAPGSIAYSNIHGLLATGNDLWIGTFEHGLDVMDVRTGRVRKHYNAGPGPFDLKSNFIVCMLQTRSGSIYAGSSNGVYKYLSGSDRFEPVALPGTGSFISCLLEDHNGLIWVGTHDRGIFSFNPVTGETGHFENEPGNKNSLTSNTINALYEDSGHSLWFATEGGGLCHFLKNIRQFVRYTTRNGLPSNFVFKVLEDNGGKVWATTSKGLVKLDRASNTFTVYTKANGLLNDQFNYNSGYKDAAGKIYFGSVRGMITFRPDAFYQNPFVPPVYITGFQVHNQELEITHAKGGLQQSVVYAGKVVLNHHQSAFSIDFAAVSFTLPGVTGYSYIMKGLDRDWTHIKSNRKVYFTNLEPGTYTFIVKAAGNGLPNSREHALTVQILSPYWATPWAYLCYALLGALLLYYLIRTYHQMLVNKREKEIYKAKIEFFTHVAHEIKTPLTLIKGPVENLSELMEEVPVIREDVVTMERNTNRLVNLVNQILDFRLTETNGFHLDFHPVNLNSLVQEVHLMFEPLARKKKLRYTLDLPEAAVCTLADDEALNKVFSNLFSNAVKYADKEVHARLIMPRKKDSCLLFEISNDGFLVPDAMREKIFEPFYRLKETMKQKGTGIGLSLARSLVELHKGQLFMQAQEAKNLFILRLPYRPVPEKQDPFTQTNAPVSSAQ